MQGYAQAEEKEGEGADGFNGIIPGEECQGEAVLMDMTSRRRLPPQRPSAGLKFGAVLPCVELCRIQATNPAKSPKAKQCRYCWK